MKTNNLGRVVQKGSVENKWVRGRFSPDDLTQIILSQKQSSKAAVKMVRGCVHLST